MAVVDCFNDLTPAAAIFPSRRRPLATKPRSIRPPRPPSTDDDGAGDPYPASDTVGTIQIPARSYFGTQPLCHVLLNQYPTVVPVDCDPDLHAAQGDTMHQTQSLSSLYPQARKLQYELKMQISYLDSGRTGGRSDEELQGEARANLSALQQLLWQLDSLVQVHPKAAEKETWVKKLQQLRNETQALGNTLEQHIFRVSRRAVEMRERESLLSRRNAGFDSANAAMYATQESESLQRSTQMVSDLTSMSHAVLGDLASQRARMKSARTKLLDIANRLGLSSSLLRVIERRDTVDAWIVMGGMVFTLIFLYVCVAYLRS